MRSGETAGQEVCRECRRGDVSVSLRSMSYGTQAWITVRCPLSYQARSVTAPGTDETRFFQGGTVVEGEAAESTPGSNDVPGTVQAPPGTTDTAPAVHLPSTGRSVDALTCPFGAERAATSCAPKKISPRSPPFEVGSVRNHAVAEACNTTSGSSRGRCLMSQGVGSACSSPAVLLSRRSCGAQERSRCRPRRPTLVGPVIVHDEDRSALVKDVALLVASGYARCGKPTTGADMDYRVAPDRVSMKD
jgi:hypothetical protein